MIKKYNLNDMRFIEITTKELKVVFCDLGASIYGIYFENKLMTQTLKNPSDYINKIYHGKTIGRSANRIKGNFISINKKTYSLSNNEGNNTLHGGSDCLSYKKI